MPYHSLMTSTATKKTMVAANTTIINQIDNNSSLVDNYIKSIRIMSNGTSYEYLTRLNSFNAFIKNEFGGILSINDLVTKIKQGKLDPYDILSRYSGYLQSSYNISALTLKQRVVTVKNFLEYYDIEI